MKRLSLFFFVMAAAMISYAQIGYQVALLNTATGEARANEEVDVEVILKGADDKTIVSQKQTLVSNDLGLLSMTIGNEDTFKNVDWNNALPLSVTVYANDILVAQSQVLNVPVAEFAKAISPIDINMIQGRWEGKTTDNKEDDEEIHYVVIKNGECTYNIQYDDDYTRTYASGKIVGINNNTVWLKDGFYITFSSDYSTVLIPNIIDHGAITLFKK